MFQIECEYDNAIWLRGVKKSMWDYVMCLMKIDVGCGENKCYAWCISDKSSLK